MTKVFLDGDLVDDVDEPEEVRDAVREMRRSGDLDRTVSVNYLEDREEVRISTDAGRVLRPVVVVDDGEPRASEEELQQVKEDEISLGELEDDGKVEYIDAQEEESAYVALNREEVTEEHTHLEIDSTITHGLSATTVVYPEHNRGDRVNFGAKMAGQGIGMYSREFHQRFDTNANVLSYGQSPMVTTQTYDEMLGDHPIGQNFIIASRNLRRLQHRGRRGFQQGLR
nr:MAG: DNA-directed RNA polymerase, beta subunit/140 kD subunit [Candidatus Nanosalinarum sp. J07AB56]